MATIYDFTARSAGGEDVPLGRFRGQVLLIVNTASRCGFTPQYQGLEALYEKYRSEGFTVLGFPCNQFGGQEPGTEDEILRFCSVNYRISFPMFAKIAVNGEGAHPLYKFLKKEKPGLFGTRKIKWNFTKFLIGRDGCVVRRFAPATKPETIEKSILRLLA